MTDQNTVDSVVTNHQTLGSFRGLKTSNGAIQYLGIQYATLFDRFARGELLGSYTAVHERVRNGVYDATMIGPIPLSPENGCAWDQTLIQKSLPFTEFKQSDTECLTLNISVPANLDASTAVPVLAWVHGGAFATGSSLYPQYDLGRFVEMSTKMGKPIIAVGINYRLGVPGFLHSSTMAAAGYKPNNGLHDQRLALLWIKKFISGFGGDPTRVTYIGESSGAASGCFHMHSEEPLFDQLITMSGTSLIRAKKPEALENAFKTAVSLMSLTGLSPRDQVMSLTKVPMADIREKIARKIPLGPIADGDLIPCINSFKTMTSGCKKVQEVLPGMRWCRRIMMGDCQMDGNAYGPRVSARTDILPKTLAHYLRANLDSIDKSLVPSIVTGYGLETSASTNGPKSTKAVLDFATDICFALGARTFVRAWSEALATLSNEAFLYRFNVPNPWDGPWKGHATHILDIAFVLQNYREFLSAGQQKTSERFATDVLAFMYGEKPWSPYKNGVEEGSMVYFAPEKSLCDGSQFVPDENPEKTGRRSIIQSSVGEDVYDKVMDAWEMFMKHK